jgi:hypothetical protein
MRETLKLLQALQLADVYEMEAEGFGLEASESHGERGSETSRSDERGDCPIPGCAPAIGVRFCAHARSGCINQDEFHDFSYGVQCVASAEYAAFILKYWNPTWN